MKNIQKIIESIKLSKKQLFINLIIISFLSIILITIDQTTKTWAFKKGMDYYYENAFVGVRLIGNTGMFGSLGDNLGYPTVQTLTCFIAIIIFTCALFSKSWNMTVALTFMFAGAMGNIIDRFLVDAVPHESHSVRDWIFTPWSETLKNGGTYNIADIEVVIGSCLSLVSIIFALFKKEE